MNYRAIYQRRTDRRPFADTPPTADDLEPLRAAVERHGVHLHILAKDQVPELAVAIADAGRWSVTRFPSRPISRPGRTGLRPPGTASRCVR